MELGERDGRTFRECESWNERYDIIPIVDQWKIEDGIWLIQNLGSWKQPPPGMPVCVNPDPQNLKMGDTVEDLDDSVSRKNFRVVIIKPYSVEATNLSDLSKARRQLYTYEESSGQWKHEELWP
jgi:hypothetical protein